MPDQEDVRVTLLTEQPRHLGGVLLPKWRHLVAVANELDGHRHGLDSDVTHRPGHQHVTANEGGRKHPSLVGELHQLLNDFVRRRIGNDLWICDVRKGSLIGQASGAIVDDTARGRHFSPQVPDEFHHLPGLRIGRSAFENRQLKRGILDLVGLPNVRQRHLHAYLLTRNGWAFGRGQDWLRGGNRGTQIRLGNRRIERSEELFAVSLSTRGRNSRQYCGQGKQRGYPKHLSAPVAAPRI